MNSMSSNQGLTSPSGRTGNKVPKGYGVGQIQQLDPRQQQLYKRGFEQVEPDSYLSRLAGGEEGAFDQLEAPAFRQFNELQGGLASRFAGMGRGALKSSGFQNTINSAASNFAQQLQVQRMGLMRQAQQDIWGMSQNLLSQRPYEQFLVEKAPKGPSGFSKFAPLAGGLIGGAIGLAGGPFGAMAGYSAGQAVGNAFG